MASNYRSNVPSAYSRHYMRRRDKWFRLNRANEGKSGLTSNEGGASSGNKRYPILIGMIFYILGLNFVGRTRISRTTIHGFVGRQATCRVNCVVVSSNSCVNSSNHGCGCRGCVRIAISSNDLVNNKQRCRFQKRESGETFSNRWWHCYPVVRIIRAPLSGYG